LWVNVEISDLQYRSFVASPSIRTTNHPRKGCGISRDPFLLRDAVLAWYMPSSCDCHTPLLYQKRLDVGSHK